MSPHIEKQAVAQSFGEAAAQYDQFAKIQHRVAQELIQQCPSLENEQPAILDLGCGTGYCLPKLAAQYSDGNIIGADLAQGMLEFAREQYPQFNYQLADAENLPFEANQFDLIFSNFAVQWCDSFLSVLQQAYKTLKPGGYLLLSTLADGTLSELKQAWASVDQHQHVNEFETADSLEEAVEKSGFNVHQLSLHSEFDFYDTVRGLTDSLKRIGAHNITSGRSKALTSPGTVKRFRTALEAYRTEQGLPASYQVFSCLLQKPNAPYQ